VSEPIDLDELERSLKAVNSGEISIAGFHTAADVIEFDLPVLIAELREKREALGDAEALERITSTAVERTYVLEAQLHASRKVVEAAKRAIAAIMAQPGEFTTDEVGLDDLLTALAELEVLKK